ncbi:MAG TPA: ABC transporter permease [bacterium]|nr:ABC transporter permease [bacterium]HPQ19576.1 ABC transporter permease [bacterium]
MILNLKIIFTLSLRNLTRNKKRTLLTIISVLMAITILIVADTYLSGLLNSIINDTIKLSGHFKIQKKEYLLKSRVLPLNIFLENSDEIIKRLQEEEMIETANKRIRFSALLDCNGVNTGGMGIAIEAEKEKKYLQIENSLLEGKYFTNTFTKKNEIILGKNIANNLKAKIGDIVTLLSKDTYGSLAVKNFEIIGIFDFGSEQLNKLFFIAIEKANEILEMRNNVPEIVLFLKDINNAEKIISNLKNKKIFDETISIEYYLESGILKVLSPLLKIIIKIIFGFFISIAILIISNTMFMSILERIKEIGVLRALGMSKESLLLIFLFEGIIIGLIGSFIGSLIGSILSLVIEKYGINFGALVKGFPLPIKTIIYGEFKPMIIIWSIISGIIVSIISGFIPAYKGANLKIVDAIREIKK